MNQVQRTGPAFRAVPRSRSAFALLVVVAFCWLTALPVLALDVPPYHGYVNDLAEMISPATEARLASSLAAFDLSDSTQVAVLTIPTLAGDAIEDFSIRVVDNWKIGQKGKDNGVLLLVVRDDRRLRIEVGRGLEGVLTDLLAGRIVDGVISPYFKAGRLDEGFEAGIGAIIKATRGEFKGDGRRVRRSRGADEPSPMFKFLFFAIVVTALLGSASRRLGMVAGSGILPLAAFFGLASPVNWLLLLLLIPVGALAGLLLPIILAGLFRGGGSYHGSGFGGGYGGGFGGGGSGGFGGFGGGGFGGGGASGSW